MTAACCNFEDSFNPGLTIYYRKIMCIIICLAKENFFQLNPDRRGIIIMK